MRGNLTVRTAASGLALAAAIGGVLALLIVSVSDFRHAARLEAHSAQTIATATRLERTTLDLETGLRGYLIAGDGRFLEPYRAAERTYPADVDRLARLTAGDPAQQTRVGALRGAIVRYHGTWAMPLIALARHDLAAARARESTGEGKAMVDGVRARFDAFIAAEQRLSAQRRAQADDRGRTALRVAAAAIVLSFLFILLFAAWVHRAIALPVRRLAATTRRLAGGDLSARVDLARSAPELRALKESFNSMADVLEANRDELEAQNSELEGQQTEIEQTLENLASEREKLALLHALSTGLVGLTSLAETSAFVLERLCEVARAEVGTLYTVGVSRPDELILRAVRGLDRAAVPETLTAGGLATAALRTRELVTTAYGESELQLESFGRLVSVRDEVHIPLLRGEQVTGVVTLGRVGGRRFGDDERELLGRLAAVAAVALRQALAQAHGERLASLNRTLIDSMPDGIRLLDLEGNVLAENRAIRELVDELLAAGSDGPVYASLADLADAMEDPEAYRASLEQLRDDPHHAGSFEFALRGSQRSFRRLSVPVDDETGAVVARLFVVRETTQERELDRLKDEFLATVTHELRTPLASIIGFTDLLLDGAAGELSDDQHRYLGIVERSSDRLHRLVGDLLFVSQLEAGGVDLRRGDVDVDALVAEAAESARPAADAKGVALKVALGSAPRLDADGQRLAQLVDNLVANAIKFTPAGGRVSVATECSADGVAVVVADTGIGIPPDARERLFTRFFRAATAVEGQVPGTGLGLAISRAIAEAHGGTISFADAPGGGSVFRVELPLAA